MKKYKVVFEATSNFDDLISKEAFEKEYKCNLIKLCKWMYKNEGQGVWDDLKLIDAYFIN